LRKLQHAVSEALSRSFADLDIEASASNGRLFAYLAAHGEVLERSYTADDRVIIHARLPQRHLGGLRQEDVTTKPHQPTYAEGVHEPANLAVDEAIEDVA
jgi:GTP-binding protein HflX